VQTDESVPRYEEAISNGNNTDLSLRRWSRNRMIVHCHFCGDQVKSKVKTTYGSLAHKLALTLCCLTGVLGICLPYFFSSLKSVTHSCPVCKNVLGVYKPKNFNKCTKKITGVIVGFTIIMIAIILPIYFFLYLPQLEELDQMYNDEQYYG